MRLSDMLVHYIVEGVMLMIVAVLGWWIFKDDEE